MPIGPTALYQLTMLIAALPLYAAGVRLSAPGMEYLGTLKIGQDFAAPAIVASLSLFGAHDESAKHCKVLPTLYDPVVRKLVNGRIDIRGIERDGKAWHLQVWSCRVVTNIEANVMHVNQRVVQGGLDAVYLRWWAVVWEMAMSEGTQRTINVADIAPMLETPIEDVWPFLEWASRTARCFTALGGKDSLGTLTIKSFQGNQVSNATDGKLNPVAIPT